MSEQPKPSPAPVPAAPAQGASTQETSRGWPDWVTPGWYIVAGIKEVAKGEVKPVTLGGKELVVFRTESGVVSVFDKYCVHLGASLALGKVKGERLECAYHHWQYATDGRCEEIPRCAKIPKKAKMGSYPVAERLGCIWVFVGDRVYYELPKDEEFFKGEDWFTGGPRLLGEAKTTCREILENIVDFAHAKTLHGFDVLSMEADIDAQKNMLVVNFVSEYPVLSYFGTYKGPTVRLNARTTMYPPSMSYQFFDFGRRHRHVFAMLQPVGPNETKMFVTAFVRGKRRTPLNWVFSKIDHMQDVGAVRADMLMWNNKVVHEQPVLSGADRGPIMPFRRYWTHLAKAAALGGPTLAELSPKTTVREPAPGEGEAQTGEPTSKAS